MIQFAIGVAMLVFSVMVGYYSYTDTQERIQNEQKRLDRAKREQRDASRVNTRVERLTQLMLPQGEDQRATIVRNLELTDNRAQFRYINQANPNNPSNKTFYRNEYEVVGPMSYAKLLQTLNKLEQMPGNIIYSVCVNCQAAGNPQRADEGEYMMLIKGYLYVHAGSEG